ncbi:PREDICTED: apolipophorins [Nicrophorus vespilloides]|uniref:Apolipophorins n=1 Tax=Nicrophorus vespilloides TaxID=110193 RepID=A0ABM1M1C5_NICVS|nr:PREDICTED: apolipophorins [Nicrophorus vespilloides]
MARLSPMKVGLALFVILAVDFVASDEKCRTGCNGVTPKTFKFAEGTTYKYNLESNADISLSSAEGQQSSTKLKATVLLTQQPNCNQVLKLQNVQVFGSDGKKHGGIPDLDKAIRLNFHDGHLEDIVCAEPGDSQNSLNIKRAVASLFQAAMNHHHETDVFGVCPTDIHTRKEGNMFIITKNRALNRCSHRENVKHDFMATAFNLHSEIKSSPILKGDYNAEMRIKGGILDHVLVTESYLYLPFSIGKNGAKASVQTKLQYVSTTKDAAKNKCTEPKSVIFENPHPVVSQKSDVSALVQAVKDTANTIGVTVGENTASKFSGLIKITAAAKKDDLLAVYNQIKSGAGFSDKTVARKTFLDALFRAGTGECIEVAIELLKNKELSELEQKMVYLGMAFVRHATPNSMTSAGALLDQPHLPREAYLGVGTLVARYCASHDCKNVDQLNKLTQKLVGKLRDGKATNREQENEIISVLKAIGNMKHLSDTAVSKIISIAQDKRNPTRLRVAALDTYQSDACKDKLRDSAINILKDIQQDSEIRIKAYLAAAKCPNGKVATAVKAVLDNEPSLQVGGFIVAHIRNLRASANPDKELAKRELSNINTMKRFPIDPRKYSFNSDLSYSFNTLGLSNSIESNIIYSQNSFMPRSSNLNLTTEIFGQKFNFLEIDARQENLDKLLEHYLGPLGLLRNKDASDLVNAGKTNAEKIWKHLGDRWGKTRSKRFAPKSEFDTIGKQVQIKSHELNNDLDLDMSVKLFGSEFLFLSVNEDAHKYTPDVIIDKIFDSLDSGIKHAKNFDHTLHSNMMFLDAELSYPTSMGMPLRLAVEGTSSVQLKASGSMDINALLSDDKDTIAKLTMIPSANIEIVGSMILDAAVMENGLKVTSTLYTATGGAAVLEFFNTANGTDVKFSLPIDKQQLLSAKHEVVFTSREVGHVEHQTPCKFIENKDFSICFDQLSPMIGLTACAELNGPNPQLNQGVSLPFPFNGNSKFAVWIEKEMPVTYHYRESVLFTSDKMGLEFLWETLGEDNKPKVSLKIEAQAMPEKFIIATLDSPIKKITVESRVTDSDKEKSFSAKLSHDGHEYSGKLGVGIAKAGAKSTYTPLIQYKTPNVQGIQKSPYTVEGTITGEESGDDKKFTFNNVRLVSPDRKPITITGNVGRKAGAYYSDISVSDGSNSGSFKGDVKVIENTIKVNGEMSNTISPMSNFKIKYDLNRKEESVSSDLMVVHGTDLKSKKNVIKMKNSVEWGKKDSDLSLVTKNSFSYPLIGVSIKFDVTDKKNLIGHDIELQYNNIKVGTEMDFKTDMKNKGDYDLEFEIYGLDNKFELDSKCEVQTAGKYKVDNKVELNGKKIEVHGIVTHKVKPHDVDVGAKLTVKCNQHAETISVDHALVYVPEDLKTHLKISTPSNVFVDFNLKAAKVSGANGHIKISLKDILNVNGEIKADKWNGKAHLIVDLVKLQRKLKTESVFKLIAPVYNVDVSFYPNFEKDNKKMIVSTHNQIKEGSVDSKNSVDAFGKKLECNVKGNIQGNPKNDGKLSGDIELILPNDMYLAGKMSQEAHIVNGIGNYNVFYNVEQRNNKNAPGRKASVKVIAKEVNPKMHTFNLDVNLALDDSNGKSLNSDLMVVKTEEQDGRRNIDVKGKTYGSVLHDPINFNLNSNCKDKNVNFQMNTQLTKTNSLSLEGSYDLRGEGNPLSGKINLDVKTDNPKLKTVQAACSGKYLANDDIFELEGSSKLFIDDDGSVPDATVNIESEGSVNLGKENGQIKGLLKFQKADPIIVALGYARTNANGILKGQADVSLQYAKGKNLKGDFSVVHVSKNEMHLEMKLSTPFEHAKLTTIQQKITRSEDRKHAATHIVLTVDDKKYVIEESLDNTETSPGFLIQVTMPDGKTDKISVKINKPNPTKFGSEVIVALNQYDFTFDGTVDANIESIEDFALTVKLDSPKLKMDKIVLEAKNKHNKAAKEIEIHATANGKNIIKGSTKYKTRDEGGKYIAEGSGEFTVKDQKQTGNFKLMKQTLVMDKNGEQGFEISFDAVLGNKAVDADLKMSNKQFRVMNSYCEEKKQCAHFEVDSKFTRMDINEFLHELEVNVDLRKLGLLHECGLKAVTSRKQLVLDHTVDFHFQSQENNKYQYSLYLHPKEAGVSFTTPKRTVAAEAHLTLPAKNNKGPIKGELNFFLNKKTDPTKKTTVSMQIEHVGDDKKGGVNADAKFSTPGLPKELSVSYKGKYDVTARLLEFTALVDVFGKANQKIHITGNSQVNRNPGKYSYELHGTAKSPGLGIDLIYDDLIYSYDAKTHEFASSTKLGGTVSGKHCMSEFQLEVNQHKIHHLLKLMNNEIYNIDCRMQLSKDAQIVDTETKIFGLKPTTSHLEIKQFNTLKFVLALKENPGNQLVINSAFIPGQIADFRAQIGSNELMKASVKLDEANFLKPEYGMNLEQIKSQVLQPAQQGVSNMLKESKVVSGKLSDDAAACTKHFGELIKNNMPDMKPIQEYYSKEFTSLKEELNADKTIQQIAELFKGTLGAVAKTMSDIITKFNEITAQSVATIKANIDKFAQIFETEIMPKLKQVIDSFLNITTGIFEKISDVFFTVLGKCSEFLDSHQAELKQLATSVSSISHDLGRFLNLNYERVRTLVVDTVKRMYEEIKALPLYEELKNKWEMMFKDLGGVTEPLINMIKDALGTLKDVLPNEDLKELISSITDYIEKKLRNEKVDDMAALEAIVKNIVKSVKKLVAQLNLHEYKLIDPSAFVTDHVYAIPRLVAARFSPLHHLLSGEYGIDTLKESMYGISFNPKSWVPPFRMYAVVVQGQHIFTFDGKHVTFPGKCNYLLTRDAVNGNFSVAGTYTNGIMTAITVTDKTDSITIKKGGQCMLNKDSTDFPIRRSQMEAFRLYTTVNVVSKAGINVRCDLQLTSCVFSVSGFYHGQLRGLLGNGNNEPYDDFTMPNGKIVTSEADFGNSYKMSPQCPTIKTVDHSAHHHAPSCNKLFGTDSNLRFCFPFVNPDNFRMACDHGVAAGVKDTEESVALGYVAACLSKNIPIKMPAEFMKCRNSDQPRDIGDKFSVKVPAKAADVIIVVDQSKSNEAIYKDLVQPMVADLNKEFAAKGINDVEYHLMGYGGEHGNYPSHFTSGGKMSWKGKLPNIKFADSPNKKDVDLGHEKANQAVDIIKMIKDEIVLITGAKAQAKAYYEALKYPFRAHAAKTFIAVTSEPCQPAKMAFLQKVHAMIETEPNVNINLITPFKDFKLKDAKVTKGVIGFNARNVFTLSDAKKKPEGTSELHKDLEYEDFCVDFTTKNDGNVFVADNFVSAKGASKKQYVQSVAHNIVHQILSVEKGYDCECSYTDSFTASNQCHAVYSNAKEVKKSQKKK